MGTPLGTCKTKDEQQYTAHDKMAVCEYVQCTQSHLFQIHQNDL